MIAAAFRWLFSLFGGPTTPHERITAEVARLKAIRARVSGSHGPTREIDSALQSARTEQLRGEMRGAAGFRAGRHA